LHLMDAGNPFIVTLEILLFVIGICKVMEASSFCIDRALVMPEASWRFQGNQSITKESDKMPIAILTNS